MYSKLVFNKTINLNIKQRNRKYITNYYQWRRKGSFLTLVSHKFYRFVSKWHRYKFLDLTKNVRQFR